MRRRVPSPFHRLSTSKWNTVAKAKLGVKPRDSPSTRKSTTPWSVLRDDFVSMIHDPFLTLPRAPPPLLIPPQRALCELGDIPASWTHVHSDSVPESVGMMEALKRVFRKEVAAKGIARNTKAFWQLERDIIGHRSDTYKDTEQLLDYMHICAKVEERLLPGTEKKVDLLAMQWALCNGFGKGSDFGLRIDTMGGAFKFLGELSESHPDVYVCRTSCGSLVLVFEDKIDSRYQGCMAQVFGEMLRLQYLHLEKKKHFKGSNKVYAVRMCFNALTAFRLEATQQQLEAACLNLHRSAAVPKMPLYTTVPDPTSDMGLSLTKQSERRDAVQLMSMIRTDVAA